MTRTPVAEGGDQGGGAGDGGSAAPALRRWAWKRIMRQKVAAAWSSGRVAITPDKAFLRENMGKWGNEDKGKGK